MSDNSRISWTEATWNAVTGCTKVSDGCKHCYVERDWHRLANNPRTVYFGRGFTDVRCHPERLEQPLRWTRPRRIFVNSVSDLFHPDVPDAFLDQLFAVMALCPHHTFQVLTKRPARMRDYFSTGEDRVRRICAAGEQFVKAGKVREEEGEVAPLGFMDMVATRPNVWLGVTVENQAAADERIPILLQVPAAVRWISAEPLLGPVDLSGAYLATRCGGQYPFKGLAGEYRTKLIDPLGWVVAGGESGPKARPSHPDWFRALRDQCHAADKPFNMKQWGEWGSPEQLPATTVMVDARSHVFPGGPTVKRFGRRLTGRLLDGLLHDDYPATGRRQVG